ncbi:transposase [Mycobacterium canetti]|uniref:transposase n=1 Tax=Mycobacterium canetti TaxID=78331 RepID=UPI002248A139|nr:transposase [Mycobacterium canetti]
MHDATGGAGFVRPDLTAFCRLDELGVEVTGQYLDSDRAVLACRITDEDRWCRRCGEQGQVRDTVTRRLAHEPFGWRPTTLVLTVRRYRCAGCAHVWRQDSSAAAEPRAKLSRHGDAVPAALTEVITLGRTLKKRAADVLAYFDRPGTSNGPTEAINGRLEHLRGSALGFRNLTHYIARSLLEAGGFKPRLHPRS